MKTIKIPNSDLNVSEIALGCMRISQLTNPQIVTLVHTALDQGINFFDHADIYSDGKCEEKFSEALGMDAALRDRMLLQTEVWDRLGVPPKEAIELTRLTPESMLFNSLLFSKIVPNCKKLGLLDPNGGWLRERFQEIGVIQFEDWVDTGEEYDAFALGTEVNGDAGTAAAG